MTGRSLGLRLAVLGLVASALVLGLTGAGLWHAFMRNAERYWLAEVEADLRFLTRSLRREDGAVALRVEPLPDPRFLEPFSGLYWQISNDLTGEVVGSPSLASFTIDLPADDLDVGVVHRHELAGPDGGRLIVLERRFPGSSAPKIAYRFAVAVDRRLIDERGEAFMGEIAPLLALLGAMLLGVTALTGRLMLAPLREARTALAEVRAGRRDGLSGALPRELDGLAREFDALLDGQRRAARIVRERAADLAHGLKTPLAVIQAKARDLDDMGRSDIGAELRDIAASMDQRLSRDLARAHIRGALAQPGGAGLAQIVARIARALARARPEPAIDWSIDIPADLTVAMDDGDLTELIGALFDNAAKWATGMVGICALPGAPAVTLLIDDDGPGLAPQHRRAALSRGALLDPERSGTGLGLAIAADVVAAYGGEIVLEDSPLGGLRVRLTLPAAGAGISSRG